ncbi:elongation of very long chain fatty acids protein AAEL008004-like [Armigeres subalbatus]|uniref:elongation of very long chain fatty acids protein AAEL008004-like n=1 Tax=Armigeres subalbatus TaxID=124917 RepID=UPI002ED06D19
MAYVLQKWIDEYNEFLQKNRDKRSTDLPLLNANWQVPLIVGIYLLTVLRIGPRFMENRKPYELKTLIRVYNLLQVLVNSILFVVVSVILIKRPDFSYVCQPVNFSRTARGYEEMFVAYAYFVLKVLDLADTVLFILRKKQSQVSFLHVYHHSIMVIVSYYGALFAPGGHNFILGIWNTLGHAAIYLYYYMATYGSPLAARCKKHLTQLQLVQFVYLTVHFGRPALTGMQCGFPKTWHWIGLVQTVFFLVMFLDFYFKSYRKPQKKDS